MTDTAFPAPDEIKDIEEGSVFAPRFTSDGLLPVMAVDAASQSPLMFAWMNAQALQLTLDTRIAHYWSRSRGKLWKKGETSGQLQKVIRIRTDCDQDVVVLDVEVQGNGAACHTGRATCFYRAVNEDGSLVSIDDERLIDPGKVYGKS